MLGQDPATRLFMMSTSSERTDTVSLTLGRVVLRVLWEKYTKRAMAKVALTGHCRFELFPMLNTCAAHAQRCYLVGSSW